MQQAPGTHLHAGNRRYRRPAAWHLPRSDQERFGPHSHERTAPSRSPAAADPPQVAGAATLRAIGHGRRWNALGVTTRKAPPPFSTSGRRRGDVLVSGRRSSNGRIIGDIPTLPAPEGEVVPGGQRGGMIRAEHPNAVGELPFELGDRAGDIPTLPAPEGEVVPGGQRGGMIRAEHPLCAVSSRSNSVTAPATSPPSPRQPAAKRCSSESMSRQNRSARRRFKQRMASLWDLPATIFVS